jgi:hypothetical protein
VNFHSATIGASAAAGPYPRSVHLSGFEIVFVRACGLASTANAKSALVDKLKDGIGDQLSVAIWPVDRLCNFLSRKPRRLRNDVQHTYSQWFC